MATIQGTSGDDSIGPGGVSPGVLGGPTGAGGDYVFGSAGDDLIDGAGGVYSDAIDYGVLPGPVAIVFDMAGATAVVSKGALGTDTLLGRWYRFLGTAGADSFTAAGGTSLHLAAVEMGAGDDTVDGGAARRAVEMRYLASPAGVAVDLAAGTAQDGWGGTDTLRHVWALHGSGHADTLRGNAADETFWAGRGEDVYDGRGGLDRLSYASTVGVAVTLDADGGGGTAAKRGGWGTDRFVGIERIEGSTLADTLTGAAGEGPAVFLDGGAGNDLIDGRGSGRNVADYSWAFVAGGLSISLAGGFAEVGAAEVDRLRDVVAVRGSRLADTIFGSAAADRIDGGGGADALAGGAGDDTYVVAGQAARIYEAADGGTDTVIASAAFRLYANLETLVLAPGSGAVQGVGNALDNLVQGNEAANRLFGLVGHDTLDGGLGADVMAGGAGDDTYVVDDVRDAVIEGVGAGTDTVVARIDWSLAGPVENLVLAADAGAIRGSGNVLANLITGNAAANRLLGWGADDTLLGGEGDDSLWGFADNDRLLGGAGADWLMGGDGQDSLEGEGGDDVLHGEGGQDSLAGGAGTDFLSGGEGWDTLDGGEGADHLEGGVGSDTYRVDIAADVVRERPGGGIDVVTADIAGGGYALPPEVESLVLAGTTRFGVGNGLDNTIVGNGAANLLVGGAGADRFSGFGGDDTLLGQEGADNFFFSPGGGRDVVADYDPARDVLGFGGFGEIVIRPVDSQDVGVFFRDADGAWLDDVVLLRGAATAGGAGMRLGAIDATNQSLSLQAEGAIVQSAGAVFRAQALTVNGGTPEGSGLAFQYAYWTWGGAVVTRVMAPLPPLVEIGG